MSANKIFNLSSAEAFAKLPSKLQRFFTRYPPAPFKTYSSEKTFTNAPDANPFLYNIHPVTKKVHDPIYSARRQADLYKLAYKYGIADLMPTLLNDRKFFQEKQDKKEILRGVLRPKGHKWERTLEQRQKVVEEGIANADQVILEYKGSKYRKRLERRAHEQKTWY